MNAEWISVCDWLKASCPTRQNWAYFPKLKVTITRSSCHYNNATVQQWWLGPSTAVHKHQHRQISVFTLPTLDPAGSSTLTSCTLASASWTASCPPPSLHIFSCLSFIPLQAWALIILQRGTCFSYEADFNYLPSPLSLLSSFLLSYVSGGKFCNLLYSDVLALPTALCSIVIKLWLSLKTIF